MLQSLQWRATNSNSPRTRVRISSCAGLRTAESTKIETSKRSNKPSAKVRDNMVLDEDLWKKSLKKRRAGVRSVVETTRVLHTRH